MADDTTTTADDTANQDAGVVDETSTDTDDLAKLKSALAAEREQRKQFEKQAKANSRAAEELQRTREAAMSEQEKAVELARAEGRTEAAREHGKQLAESKFEAALAKKGIDLGPAADLIDKTRFVAEDGSVDTDAIKKAVDQLAKLAPKSAGASGGDFGGGNGSGAPPKNLREQIAEAEAKKDYKTSRLLKSQLALQQTSQ